MSLVDKIEAHFEQLGSRKIDMPEWGVTIYAAPVTIADRKKVDAIHPDDTSGLESMIDMIIHKARDEDGNRVFDRKAGDADVLRRKVPHLVIQRIYLAMIAGPTLEQVEKNSEAIPGAKT
jgi:hypothetical protein